MDLEINRRGCTRIVILVGGVAIKIPNVRNWKMCLNGLLANMQERQFWTTKWPELCPVVFAVPGGFVTVMRRAKPLSRMEWFGFDAEKWKTRDEYTIPVENKMDSFGWLDGRIVAVDYGN